MADFTLKYHKLKTGLDKLPKEEIRKGKENNFWIVVDGKEIDFVTYPKDHSRDISKGLAGEIRKRTKLSPEEFYNGLIKCPLRGERLLKRYREILKEQEKDN